MNWRKLFSWFGKDKRLDTESKYITLKPHSPDYFPIHPTVESAAWAIERLEMERIRLTVEKLEYEKAEREGPLI